MYRKNIIAKSIGLSAAVTAVILLLMLNTGVASAALISGVGGFTVQAGTIDANNTVIYVNSGPVSGSSVPNNRYPVLNLELDSVTIQNFRLEKRIDNPVGLNGEARLIITQQAGQSVTAESLLLQTSSFNASTSTFRGLQVRETATTETTQKINITAGSVASDFENIGPRTAQYITLTEPSPGTPGVTITDANIRGHYLVTRKLSVQQLVVGVEYYDSTGTQITSL